MRKRLHIVLTAVLVGAYLSTWSAALLQTIAFPALGSGPEKIHTSRGPSEEKPQVSFAQRRHTPSVKSITLIAPPPSSVEYPRRLTWAHGAQLPGPVMLPLVPALSSHPGRAPPNC